MPLFEYKCKNCNSIFEILNKSQTTTDEVYCPNCKSNNSEKLISVFSALNTSKSGSSGFCHDGSCDLSSYGGCKNGMCGLN